MLTFKALWIDDTPQAAEPKIEGIQDFLSEEGFVFEHVLRENADEIEVLLNDPDLDIVITDFNLTGITAYDLITKIRRQHKYIELVLYSENPPGDFEKVRQSFQGIYGCTRHDVEDTIKDVIRNSIKRTQSVNNMRGIVISEAIDIENNVQEIIISYFADKGDVVRKALERGNFDFGKKVMLLGSIAKKLRSNLNSNQKGFEKIADVVKSLCKDVVWTRNVLSHVKRKTDRNGQHILTSDIKSPDGTDTIILNTEWYKETRKKLGMHSGNLKAFADFITSGVVKTNAPET